VGRAIGGWFPQLSDPAARASTWPLIAPHCDRIKDGLDADVTVATIAQRLRDDYGVRASESSVRRWIATHFAEGGGPPDQPPRHAVEGLGLLLDDLDLPAGRLLVHRDTRHRIVYHDELTHTLAGAWLHERRRVWGEPPTHICSSEQVTAAAVRGPRRHRAPSPADPPQ
jgi:hypothetical protein